MRETRFELAKRIVTFSVHAFAQQKGANALPVCEPSLLIELLGKVHLKVAPLAAWVPPQCIKII